MLLRACLALAFGVFAAGDAAALVTHCLDNAGGLRVALALGGSVGEDVEIRLRPGIYSAGGQPFSTVLAGGHTLTVSGGWSGNCAIQFRDPTLTVLDGGGQSAVLLLSTTTGATLPRANFSNLAIEGGSENNTAAGMVVYLAHGAADVVIERMRFRGNVSAMGPGGGLGIELASNASVLVRNNLFLANSARAGGAIAVTSLHSGAATRLLHNTILDNTATGSGAAAGGIQGMAAAGGAGSVELRNNLVFDNLAGGVPRDVHAEAGSGFFAANNAYGAASTGSVAESGTRIVADPQLAGIDNLRLASGSPLIDAGAPLTVAEAEGRDHAYQPRVRGAAPDIGAYESNYALFADSFED